MLTACHYSTLISTIFVHRNGGIQRSTLTTKTSGDRSIKLTLISTKERQEPKDPVKTTGCHADVHVDGKENFIPTSSNGSIAQNVKEGQILDCSTKVKFPSVVEPPISVEGEMILKGNFSKV